jgi:hypothetical protein
MAEPDFQSNFNFLQRRKELYATRNRKGTSVDNLINEKVGLPYTYN